MDGFIMCVCIALCSLVGLCFLFTLCAFFFLNRMDKMDAIKEEDFKELQKRKSKEND